MVCIVIFIRVYCKYRRMCQYVKETVQWQCCYNAQSVLSGCIPGVSGYTRGNTLVLNTFVQVSAKTLPMIEDNKIHLQYPSK